MTKPEISGIAPFFIVKNVPAALWFYRDRLGFDITFQGPSDDDIFFGIVQRGAAMIMLKDVGVDPVPNYTRDIKKGIARWDAYLHVPDPDALAAEFSSRNVEFFQPLKDDDDGLRGFEVKDADGYMLFFGRPRSGGLIQSFTRQLAEVFVFSFPTNRWTDLANELGSGFAPRVPQHDETDEFVTENYAELKARKVFAAGVPEDLGGGGASVADLAGMLRTLAHYCSSTALALSMHTHLVATAAWRWKNQKAPVDGLLKRVAAEDLVLVSTGGADWLLGSGKATKVDGGYRVTGRKIFCSGAPAGGLMMTTAVVDDPADGPTVLQIAVPTSAQGVRVENDWRALGMRGTGSHDISFEDVFVP